MSCTYAQVKSEIKKETFLFQALTAYQAGAAQVSDRANCAGN